MRTKRIHFGRDWTATPPPECCPLCGIKLTPVALTVEAGKNTLIRSNVNTVKVIKAAGRPYLTHSDLVVHLGTTHRHMSNGTAIQDSCVCGFKPFLVPEGFARTARALGDHLQALGAELEAHLLFYSLGNP